MIKEFEMFASDKNEHYLFRYSLFEADFKLFRILEELDKIYVAKESEHIFNQKKGDLTYGVFFLYFDEKGYNIIMRDNKQFFMPEVENE
jgi:hypothetical protein